MNYIRDFGLRIELSLLAKKIQKVSKKVQSKRLRRHPNDYIYLIDELANASESLANILEKLKD